jgi:hypothetical protein
MTSATVEQCIVGRCYYAVDRYRNVWVAYTKKKDKRCPRIPATAPGGTDPAG